MKKIATLLILLLIPVIIHADDINEKPVSEPITDVPHWMTYYYQNPEPERILEAIRVAHDSKVLSTGKIKPVMVAFFSQVFRDNPLHITSISDSCTFLTPSENWTVAMALWSAETDASRNQLRLLVEKNSNLAEFLEKEPEKLLEMNDIKPNLFDMFWARFFATGDTRYVQKIIDVLGKTPSESKPVEMVYIATAYWSLKSNCIQHPKILEYCREVIDELPELSKSEMQKILAEIDESID